TDGDLVDLSPMIKPRQSLLPLLALTMGAALLVVGCGAEREVSGQPSVTTASPTAQPSVPPEGNALSWYSDSSGHLVALDWTGKAAGQVALTASTQTPDGSKLSSASGEVYDVAGHLVGHADFTKGRGPFWADDSIHVCSFVPPG